MSQEEENDDSDFLSLSLGGRWQPSRRPPPPPLPPPNPSPPPQTRPQIPLYSPQMQSLYYPNPPVMQLVPSNRPLHFPSEVVIARSPPPQPRMHSNVAEPPSLGRGRARRNAPRNNNGEDNNIQPPYPWATNRPSIVHDMARLKRMKIETITGIVRCNKCDKDYEIGFNLEEKIVEFRNFVAGKKGLMHDRAGAEWSSPPSLTCEYCTSDGVKPIIGENKENINWLFLFLGQMLGYCTLEQLKYFCGCTSNHRTGAKDRVLYLAYREIFKQLFPDWPQDSW